MLNIYHLLNKNSKNISLERGGGGSEPMAKQDEERVFLYARQEKD